MELGPHRESQGNLAYRVGDGYVHDGRAADEYTYNSLRFSRAGSDTSDSRAAEPDSASTLAGAADAFTSDTASATCTPIRSGRYTDDSCCPWTCDFPSASPSDRSSGSSPGSARSTRPPWWPS